MRESHKMSMHCKMKEENKQTIVNKTINNDKYCKAIATKMNLMTFNSVNRNKCFGVQACASIAKYRFFCSLISNSLFLCVTSHTHQYTRIQINANARNSLLPTIIVGHAVWTV